MPYVFVILVTVFFHLVAFPLPLFLPALSDIVDALFVCHTPAVVVVAVAVVGKIVAFRILISSCLRHHRHDDDFLPHCCPCVRS